MSDERRQAHYHSIWTLQWVWTNASLKMSSSTSFAA